MANKQVVEVPVWDAEMRIAMAELDTASQATVADAAEMAALFADRFDRNTALYIKEGGVIETMYGIMQRHTDKVWKETELFAVCKERYGMTMESARFNRCHRLYKAQESMTAKQWQGKVKAYRLDRADKALPLKIETLVPYVTDASERTTTPESIVKSYNKAMEGSVLDWTTFSDPQLDALIKQALKERGHRKWARANPDDSHAKSFLAALAAGLKRRGAAILKSA